MGWGGYAFVQRIRTPMWRDAQRIRVGMDVAELARVFPYPLNAEADALDLPDARTQLNAEEKKEFTGFVYLLDPSSLNLRYPLYFEKGRLSLDYDDAPEFVRRGSPFLVRLQGRMPLEKVLRMATAYEARVWARREPLFGFSLKDEQKQMARFSGKLEAWGDALGPYSHWVQIWLKRGKVTHVSSGWIDVSKY